MMSRFIVPTWNLKHQQRQEQLEAAQETNTSSHVNNNENPMSSNYEVAELKWENGQLAMHGLGDSGGLIPTKLTWGGSRSNNDTLESIVHQATVTRHNNNNNKNKEIALNSPAKMNSNMVLSSGGNSSENSRRVPVIPGLPTPADNSDQFGRKLISSVLEEERGDHRSACATFSRDTDTSMMTRASCHSHYMSLKTKTIDEDSAAGHGGSEENQDDDHETRTGRSSHSSRRSRDAAVHNQSERRRRDRINQKMRALQRLVPNASKTDKASMLDEVIDYLKKLKAQVQMMSNMRNNMPQMNMMMPLGFQQQLQMSLLAHRMGMGVDHLGMGGMVGMYDMNTMAAAAAAAAARSVPPSHNPLIHLTAPVSPFIVPSSMIPTCPQSKPNSDPGRDINNNNNASAVPLPDPYCAFLAQSMNVESYNKMAALFRQQVNQSSQATCSRPSTQSNHIQND